MDTRTGITKEMQEVYAAIRHLDAAWAWLPDDQAERLSKNLRRLMTATSRTILYDLPAGDHEQPTPRPETFRGSP
jgi:hypothetical protein